MQDVLCSLGRWASGTQARGVARALMGRSDGAEELDATKPESLTGELDSGLTGELDSGTGLPPLHLGDCHSGEAEQLGSVVRAGGF